MDKTMKPAAYKHSKNNNNLMNSSPQASTQEKKAKNQEINKLTKKRTEVTARHGNVPSVSAMAIDKLYLDLHPSRDDLPSVLERAQQLRHAGQLGKGSSKSTFFQHAFVLKLPSKAIVRFHIVPNNSDKGAPMQMVLNPNQMEESDCSLIIATMKILFPVDAQVIVAAMRIRRIDVCIQLGLPIDDLIIDLKGAMAGAKVFVSTDRGGRQQTVYLGSVESAHHGCAYDQVESDEFKRRVGEKPSRASFSDDAELTLKKRASRTQLESRRVFPKPVTLAELAEMNAPLSSYRILQLNTRMFKNDLPFCGYVDSVRVRGVHGARHYLLEQCGKNQESMMQIQKWESRLDSMAVSWWKPEDYSASLLETLENSAAWKFLRIMKKRTRTS